MAKYFVQSIYKTAQDTSNPTPTPYTNYDSAVSNFYTKHGNLVAEASTVQVSTIMYDEMHNVLEQALWIKEEAKPAEE